MRSEEAPFVLYLFASRASSAVLSSMNPGPIPEVP